MSASAPPAAWYPDPSGVGEHRYWDGSAWTPHVATAGQVTQQPMPWPPVTTAPQLDDKPTIPGRAALYALAGFVVGLVGGLGFAIAGSVLDLPNIVILLLNVVGLWFGLLGACWYTSRRYGTGNVLRDFDVRIGGGDAGWGILMSIAARVAGALVLIPFVVTDQEIAGNTDAVYEEASTSVAAFVVFAVVAVIGAPLVEELFFRGLLLRSLSSLTGVRPAMAAQAALFALAHFSPLLGWANLSVMAVIGAAGVVFGITARRWRLGTSVVAHGAFNLMSVVAAAFLLF